MLKQFENLLKNEIDPAYALRARFIFEEIEKEKPKRVLEVGSGRGFYIHSLCFFPFIEEIHGIDLNEKYIGVAREHIKDKRVHLQVGDVYHLPFPDNFFDTVIASEILEHLKDDKKALKEIKRVLKPQGAFLVSVPNLSFPFLWDPLNWLLMRVFKTHVNKDIWWLAGIWADHEKLYTADGLNRVVSSFFRVEKETTTLHYCLPFSHFFLYAIGKNLVEALKIKSVDRFSFKEKGISVLISSVFRFPSRFESKNGKYKSSMNILLKARKT